MKKCKCRSENIKMKFDVGYYNDHFHFLECQDCGKRTKGCWMEDDAIKEWDKRKFVIIKIGVSGHEMRLISYNLNIIISNNISPEMFDVFLLEYGKTKDLKKSIDQAFK